MKRLAFILFSMCLPLMSFAEQPDSAAIVDQNGEIDNEAFQSARQYFIDNKESEFIKQLDEQHLSDTEKADLYKAKLAQKIYEDYRSAFTRFILDKERETGRKMHIQMAGNGTYYWLDRGPELESEKCKKIYLDRNTKAMENHMIFPPITECFYPNGYEQYSLYVENDGGYKSLYFQEEDKSSNMVIRRIVEIKDKDRETNKAKYSDKVLDVSRQVGVYDLVQRSRNEDLRNGGKTGGREGPWLISSVYADYQEKTEKM